MKKIKKHTKETVAQILLKASKDLSAPVEEFRKVIKNNLDSVDPIIETIESFIPYVETISLGHVPDATELQKCRDIARRLHEYVANSRQALDLLKLEHAFAGRPH